VKVRSRGAIVHEQAADSKSHRCRQSEHSRKVDTVVAIRSVRTNRTPHCHCGTEALAMGGSACGLFNPAGPEQIKTNKWQPVTRLPLRTNAALSRLFLLRFGLAEQFDYRLVESGNVIWIPARNHVPISHGRFVHPFRARVFQISLQRRP